MPFGFGPGSEMQKDYNRNASLLTKRKSLKELSGNYKEKSQSIYLDEEVNEESMALLKQKLIKERKDRDTKQIIVLMLLSGLVTALLLVILN